MDAFRERNIPYSAGWSCIEVKRTFNSRYITNINQNCAYYFEKNIFLSKYLYENVFLLIYIYKNNTWKY
jgi:hypothetical protein